MRSVDEIAQSFHYSREGLAQRLISALVLGREPVGWNDRGAPTAQGLAYIQAVDRLAFGSVHAGEPTFVDEYELVKRPGVDTKDASPDHAVLWDDRALIIELKTEKASHMPGQCEWYVDLGRHHNPGRVVDLIYLTGPMAAWSPTKCPEGSRTAHLTWGQVNTIVQQLWSHSPSASERELAQMLARVVDALSVPWSAAKFQLLAPAALVAATPAPKPASGSRDWEEAARCVAVDHKQRAIEAPAEDLEGLWDVRDEIAADLLRSGIGAGHVRPWVWRRASSGAPMTDLGRLTGYEIRLSWYQ